MDKFEAKLKVRNMLDEKLWAYRYAKDFCDVISKESMHYLSKQSVDRMIVEEGTDGYVFLGETKNGQRESCGFEYNLDGVLFMGEWHAGKYHGKGFLFSDYHCFCGLFRNGSYCDKNIITGVGSHMWVNKDPSNVLYNYMCVKLDYTR